MPGGVFIEFNIDSAIRNEEDSISRPFVDSSYVDSADLHGVCISPR